MSDLASAADALGVPEELVSRSAKARATASGVQVDELVAAWAGGGPAPAGSTPREATVEAAPEAEVSESSNDESVDETVGEPVPASAEATSAAAETATSPAPSASPASGVGVTVIDRRAGAAPVLVGRVDNPLLYVAGIVLLFVLGAVVSIGLPAADAQSVAATQLPGTTPDLSDQAIEGRSIYLREGCFYCHTQLVRSVVTDVGLGPVTEPGTSPALAGDTFGLARVGPDLAHVGSREPTNDPAYLRSFLRDPLGTVPNTDQPSYGYLSEDDLDALVQYLIESK